MTLPRGKIGNDFPDPIVDGESVVVFDGVDTVSMPLWYWKKVVRYVAIREKLGE